MRKRSKQIKIWVSEKEKEKLERRVLRLHLSVSEYVRLCCLGNKKIVIVDPIALAEIQNEINRIGNNVNQITRLANSKKSVDPLYITRLNKIMSALRLEINERLNALISGGV